MPRSRDPPSEKETFLTRFQKQIKVKKRVKLIVQSSLAKKKKIKAELIMTFKNIFSSVANFRDVESVLPCNPTNNGKKNICGCAKKLIDREN